MKKYIVEMDVIFTGNIEIEAKSEAEAKKLAKEKHLYPKDLDDFYYTGVAKVLEIDEVK